MPPPHPPEFRQRAVELALCRAEIGSWPLSWGFIVRDLPAVLSVEVQTLP